MLGCLVLLSTGTCWGRNYFLFPVHVCVEPVVAGTQSCQNHLAEPVKKVVCILLLSGLQRCFDDGGLFLVMDDGCSSCAQTASIVEELTTTYWLVQQLDKQTPLQKGHKRSISSTSNLGISDHHAIFFDSKMCATCFKPANRILYMWGNVNINAIKQKSIALSNTYYSTNIHLLIIDTAVY